MPSERIQRRIDSLLDEADVAMSAGEWAAVAEKARAVLAMDPENEDAPLLLKAAEANGAGASALLPGQTPGSESASPSPAARERGPGGEGSAAAPVDVARVAELEAAAEHSGNPLDRLEEGVFVGRARELERLRTALDGAVEGRGALVMLVGEPGTGKTRTTQELASYARSREVTVLWGGARESAGAPPYWPWVQAARSYRAQTPEDERRRAWQPYAVELQRIFSGLRELFPNLPPPPEVDTEEGAFRLYDAFSSFLRAVAERTPLLVVLDDLHWADHATLRMLGHLVHELAHARLLVVGTYRDTDLDRRHPLAQTLADLNREDLFTRIPVRGLAASESTEYIRRTTGLEPAPELAQRIYEETEGNPFFLAEVVNLMAQEGTLSASARDVQIPEGVRQALGRRLDRLSDESNVLLTTLAVAGREFDHALAVRLSGHDDATTLALLEEALRARVLEEPGPVGRYRFRHALMQETLLGELSAARQVLVHGQVAEAMEALYGLDDGDHLAELAEHYAESAVLNAAHAKRAAQTLRLAAEVAAGALAWDEAARLYERCIALVTAAPDRLGEDEGLLWLQLAMMRLGNSNETTGWQAFDRAVALLETRPEDIAPAAVRIALRTRSNDGGGRWRRLAHTVGSGPSLTAYRLLAVFAAEAAGSAGDDAADRAAAMDGQFALADPGAAFLLAVRAPRTAANLGLHADALSGQEGLRTLAAAVGALPMVLASLASATMCIGELNRLAEICAEWSDALVAAGNSQLSVAPGAIRARVLWRREGQAAFEAQVDHLPQGPRLDLLRAEVALETGDVSAAREALPALGHPFLGRPPDRAVLLGLRCAVLVADGDLPVARVSFAAWKDHWDASPPSTQTFALSSIDDAICALADRTLLAQIATDFESWTEWRFAAGGTGPDYLRGAIALTLDRVDDAERWFSIGLEWATKWGLDTVIGRNRYGLARVAERRGDLDAARAHLDAAAMLFERRGAKLYLADVEARRAEWGL